MGWLAGLLTKGKGFGVAGNLVIGAIGALLGGFLFGVVGFRAVGIIAQIIMAVVGAVVLLYLLSLIGKKK